MFGNRSTRRLFLGAALTLGSIFFTGTVAAAPTICEPDPGTDQVIGYGELILCEIDTNVDRDLFRFVGGIGDKVVISMAAEAGPMDPCLRLFEEGNTNAIQEDCDASSDGDPAEISRTLSSNGTYLISVSDVGINEVGDYSVELLCMMGPCVDIIPSELYGYTPVEPCRIVDTRFMSAGALGANETRSFYTYGNVANQNQALPDAPADYPTTCPFALGEHSAVNINVTVVPQSPANAAGYLTVWPFGEDRPAASLVNYKEGVQNVANAAVVSTNNSNAGTREISVFANRSVHLVIDVLGYYTR